MTHNYEMVSLNITEIYQDIRFMSLKERMDVPGMPKERADIIIAGCCAVQTLLKSIGASKLVVSGSGLREGVFYDYYLNGQTQQTIKNVSVFSVDNLIKRYNINTDHANHVKRLSLELFDQLSDLHKLTSEHRNLLSIAALLHDIGIVVDFYSRDEHTYYLITNSRLTGLSHREIIMTALIAAKFAGNKFKKYCSYHSDIITLEDCDAIKKLIILLYICDKLDRSKSSVIKEVNCSITSTKVIIKTAKLSGCGELEIVEANKLKSNFKRIFGKTLEIR
jgi:exopolyphosphatase/guanosine-5'-triphosphate,3'-diphosphate pyrophosphatase